MNYPCIIVLTPARDVFTFTRLCDLKDVKVVILEQEPYHGPKQAHGLSFSVRKNIPSSPSLETIFKELKNDIPNFERPNHGTLTGWAKQDSCLTVEKNRAYSHKGKGWEIFTTRHHILTAAHPSPLSASNGFMGCNHFSQTNNLLKSAGLSEIDWSYLPSEDELSFN